MYKWKLVKSLEKDGLSIRQIAKKLKISKNTVNKYINSQNSPEYKSRDYKLKIEEFSDQILEMKQKNFIGSRIYDELKKLGYDQEITCLYRYLRKLKAEDSISKSTTRFESVPGSQMQYDWKEWYLPIGGKKVKIYIHQLILSYSRKKFCVCSLSITSNDIIRAIKEGVESFGGVAPELVIDNPKQMIITHEKSGLVRYNDEFLKFCGLYLIEPSACRPYRPRTKGKVERPFFFIQEHLLRGLSVDSLSEFEFLLKDFIDKYNQREHSTLKESPDNLYWNEIDSLIDLPKVEPTKLFRREFRKVSNDGYVSFNSSYYPVPMTYALKNVSCESVFGSKILIYDDFGQLVLETDKTFSNKPIHPEHLSINNSYLEKKNFHKTTLLSRFKDLFPDVAELYFSGLKTESGSNVYWHLSEILSYLDFYSKDSVERALKESISIGSFHKNSIKRLLKVTDLNPVTKDLKTYISNSTDIKRSLSAYGGLV